MVPEEDAVPTGVLRDPHWTRMSVEGFTSQLTKLDKRYGWTGG